MSKDPAFLFYPSDWMGGTMTMSRAQKGAYIDLLMCQFNQGHMTIEDIKIILGKDFDTMWEQKLKFKFRCNKNGLYYNERLEEEKEKRQKYILSRRNNISGINQYSKKSGHMGGHMEDEDENENINIIDNKIDQGIVKGEFEKLWELYPKKDGRKAAEKHFNTSVKTEEDLKNINKALNNYIKCETVKNGFIKNGATWFNNWQDWIDWQEPIKPAGQGRKECEADRYKNVGDRTLDDIKREARSRAGNKEPVKIGDIVK